MAQCKGCKWWDQVTEDGRERGHPPNLGWCMRFPPTPKRYDRWPKVSAEHFCGEHSDLVLERERNFLKMYIQMLDEHRHLNGTYDLIETEPR